MRYLPAALSLVVVTASIAGAQDSGPARVRAAGMPLPDGALAPGMLTVRVVRGAFSANVPGQVVQLEIAGGEHRRATTGKDGRGEFAHLPIGAQVRASAHVDGERLESEFFAVPSEAGVRLLFVVGDGAAAAPPPTAWPAAQAKEPPTADRPVSDLSVIRALIASVTLGAFALVLFRRLFPKRQ